MKIFHVYTRVRPKPEHPNYWNMQFGYAGVFVAAEDQYDAAAKSERLLEMLPYEIVGTGSEVTTYDAPPAPESDHRKYYDMATLTGLCWTCGIVTPGGDEDGLEREFEQDGSDGAPPSPC